MYYAKKKEGYEYKSMNENWCHFSFAFIRVILGNDSELRDMVTHHLKHLIHLRALRFKGKLKNALKNN